MNHSPTQSPVAPRPTVIATMTFPEAMQAIIEGQIITKMEWGDPEIRCHLMNGLLCIFRHDTDNQWHPWSISDGDMAGTDWIVV